MFAIELRIRAQSAFRESLRLHLAGTDIVTGDPADEPARVLLVGGAPMSGKTTVARRLSVALGWDLVHIDDLAAAARVVARDDLRDALDPMRGMDWREYYLRHSVEHLVSHATQMHTALWPALVAVVAGRASWGHPAVIEGWALLPSLVRAEGLPATTRAIWLFCTEDVFTARIRADTSFYAGARDEEGVIEKFAARSRRLNTDHAQAAEDAGFPVAGVAGETSVAEVVADVRRLTAPFANA